MADIHHHGTHSTVVEERDGTNTALTVLIAVAVIAFLIWLFAFSGVFGGSETETNNFNMPGDTTEQTTNEGGGTTGGTTDGETTDGGTGTETQTDTDTTTE